MVDETNMHTDTELILTNVVVQHAGLLESVRRKSSVDLQLDSFRNR